MSAPVTTLVELRDAKHRARSRLIRGFTEALIDADELDRRLELLEGAEGLAAIEHTVADLAIPGVPDGGSLVLLPSQVPKRRDRELTAMFVKRVRDGCWTPAPRVLLRAGIADVTLDFTSAQLRTGVTIVHVDAGLSVARVIVPPGLAVDVDVELILGTIRRDPGIPEVPDIPEEPSLVLDGYVILSRLEIVLGPVR